jgi:hypothetical protein
MRLFRGEITTFILLVSVPGREHDDTQEGCRVQSHRYAMKVPEARRNLGIGCMTGLLDGGCDEQLAGRAEHHQRQRQEDRQTSPLEQRCECSDRGPGDHPRPVERAEHRLDEVSSNWRRSDPQRSGCDRKAEQGQRSRPGPEAQPKARA